MSPIRWSPGCNCCEEVACFVTAAFTWAFIGDPAAYYIQFTDGSVSPSGDTIDTWLWDFGDGTGTDPRQNPDHTFSGPGPWLVTLTASVSTKPGCEDTFAETLDLSVPCENAPSHFLATLSNCKSMPSGGLVGCVFGGPVGRELCDDVGGGDPGYAGYDFTKSNGAYNADFAQFFVGAPDRYVYDTDYIILNDSWTDGLCNPVVDQTSKLEITVISDCEDMVGPGNVLITAAHCLSGGPCGDLAQGIADWSKTITLLAGQRLRDVPSIILEPTDLLTGGPAAGNRKGLDYAINQPDCAFGAFIDGPRLTLVPNG